MERDDSQRHDPLPPRFIEQLSAGDSHIAKAARNLNRDVRDFTINFTNPAFDAPSCRVLTARGAPLQAHVKSHLGVAMWLLGVRIKEHLTDLVAALLGHRILNAALVTRAVVESCAAAVYLQEKLEMILDDRSAEAYGQALDELHRSIGGGRFDWYSPQDDVNTNVRLKLYRAGDDPEVPADTRATSVLTMLVKLDRRVQNRAEELGVLAGSDIKGGVIRFIYAQLCDFCHPATGTAILLLSPGDDDGWITVGSATGWHQAKWFFSNWGVFVPVVCEVAYDALARLPALISYPES